MTQQESMTSGVRFALPEQDVVVSDAQAPVPGPEATSAPAQAQPVPETPEHMGKPPVPAQATTAEQQAANRTRAPNP